MEFDWSGFKKLGMGEMMRVGFRDRARERLFQDI